MSDDLSDDELDEELWMNDGLFDNSLSLYTELSTELSTELPPYVPHPDSVGAPPGMTNPEWTKVFLDWKDEVDRILLTRESQLTEEEYEIYLSQCLSPVDSTCTQQSRLDWQTEIKRTCILRETKRKEETYESYLLLIYDLRQGSLRTYKQTQEYCELVL